MWTRRSLLLLPLFTGCFGEEPVPSLPHTFEPTVYYSDTLAAVGRFDESNPLLVFGSTFRASLVDDSTLVLGESSGLGGRLVAVNLLTGRGWEILSPAGAAGPGELDGQQPMVFTSGDTVRALLANGRLHAWSSDGVLLSSTTVDPQEVFGFGGAFGGFPEGILGNRIMIPYQKAVDFGRPESVQELPRGIRIYDPMEGLIADIREGMPVERVRIVRDEGGAYHTETVGENVGLISAARGDFFAHSLSGSHTVVVRDAFGVEVATRDLPWPIEGLRIDADGRLWAAVAAPAESRGGRYIVMDRTLRELFRTLHLRVIDAAGDVILVLEPDDATGLLHLLLIGRN